MEYKKNIIIFTTDTLHHRYLIQKINNLKFINLIVIFETSVGKTLYKNFILEKKNEKNFEKKNFFSKVSYKLNNKIYLIKNINSHQTIKIIKKYNPVLSISFGTRKIFKDIIKASKFKIINIHRGIISRYRGLDSEYWAAYHKDFKSIGTSLHFIDEDFDKGKLILEKRLKLKKNMKSYQLRYYLTLLIENDLKKIIENIFKNKKINKKNINIARYYSHIPLVLKKKACKDFNKFCMTLQNKI